MYCRRFHCQFETLLFIFLDSSTANRKGVHIYFAQVIIKTSKHQNYVKVVAEICNIITTFLKQLWLDLLGLGAGKLGDEKYISYFDNICVRNANCHPI